MDSDPDGDDVLGYQFLIQANQGTLSLQGGDMLELKGGGRVKTLPGWTIRRMHEKRGLASERFKELTRPLIGIFGGSEEIEWTFYMIHWRPEESLAHMDEALETTHFTIVLNKITPLYLEVFEKLRDVSMLKAVLSIERSVAEAFRKRVNNQKFFDILLRMIDNSKDEAQVMFNALSSAEKAEYNSKYGDLFSERLLDVQPTKNEDYIMSLWNSDTIDTFEKLRDLRFSTDKQIALDFGPGMVETRQRWKQRIAGKYNTLFRKYFLDNDLEKMSSEELLKLIALIEYHIKNDLLVIDKERGLQVTDKQRQKILNRYNEAKRLYDENLHPDDVQPMDTSNNENAAFIESLLGDFATDTFANLRDLRFLPDKDVDFYFGSGMSETRKKFKSRITSWYNTLFRKYFLKDELEEMDSDELFNVIELMKYQIENNLLLTDQERGLQVTDKQRQQILARYQEAKLLYDQKKKDMDMDMD